MNKTLIPGLNVILLQIESLPVEDYRTTSKKIIDLTIKALDIIPNAPDYKRLLGLIKNNIGVFAEIADPKSANTETEELFKIMVKAHLTLLRHCQYNPLP